MPASMLAASALREIARHPDPPPGRKRIAARMSLLGEYHEIAAREKTAVCLRRLGRSRKPMPASMLAARS